MHAQIITFNLDNMTEEGYLELCDGLTAAYAELPGLLAKVWLSDAPRNTFGGVYFWRDRESMEAYLASDLLRAVGASPHLQNIASHDFAVYDDLTRRTQPELAIVTPVAAR